MRANRKFVNNDDGQVGIGTMIVFIATILVAAVAAGVLIDTSGKLQERSSRTGNEATEKVSGNLETVSIIGKRDATSNANLMDLDIYLSVAPGAPAMDLSQLRVQLKTSTAHKTFDHVDGTADADSFNVTETRDVDNSFNAKTGAAATDTWTVNGGDLVLVTLALDTCTCELATRKEVSLHLVPEVGNPIIVGFTTPASYGTATKVTLV